MSGSDETHRYIEPASHEINAWLMFTEAGLSPYYALHAVTRGRNYDEPTEGEFPLGGETWTAEVSPRSSNLKPKPDPSFEFETVKEFTVKARPENAGGEEQRKATYHIAPRWEDLESLGDSPNPSNPLGCDGVAVHVQGSNLPLDAYPELLRRAMGSVSINSGYFEEIHPFSNITAYERYLRAMMKKLKAAIGRGGTFERIWEHVGSGDGSYREFVEDNREVEGYYNTVAFDTGGAETLIPSHSLGKQLKHYHPKHVRSEGSDDPLAHPKIAACYKKDRTDSGSVRWSDREELERELDEILLNVLSWSGLTIRADYRTYVADSHFEAVEIEGPISIIDDPLPEIKREQGEVVHHAIAESIESDRQVMKVMADGGREQSVDSLAEETDLSTRTIYRKVNRLTEILELGSGKVRFASEYLRDRIMESLDMAARSLKADDEAGDPSSAWGRWAARYGVEVDDRKDARLALRLGKIPANRDLEDVLKDLYYSWPGSSRRFETAKIHFERDGFKQIQTGYEPPG